jgi:hypothetical protein
MNFVEKARLIVARHRAREAAGDPQAEAKLLIEIARALSVAQSEHNANGVEDMTVRRAGSTVPGPATPTDRARIAMTKVLEGKPLTSDDEDAILFDGL